MKNLSETLEATFAKNEQIWGREKFFVPLGDMPWPYASIWHVLSRLSHALLRDGAPRGRGCALPRAPLQRVLAASVNSLLSPSKRWISPARIRSRERASKELGRGTLLFVEDVGEREVEEEGGRPATMNRAWRPPPLDFAAFGLWVGTSSGVASGDWPSALGSPLGLWPACPGPDPSPAAGAVLLARPARGDPLPLF